MGLGSVNDNLNNTSTVTNPVTDYANQVNEEKEQKRLEYEVAKQAEQNAESVFKKAEADYLAAKRQCDNGKNVFGFNSLKNKFSSALSSRTAASNWADIKRSSYQSSIFFAGKINNEEALANAILAK